MRYFFLLFLGILLPITANSQIIKAKVYDSETTVKGIRVTNKTQNRVTGTNINGDFSIVAKISDTLTFTSLFHHPKEVVVTEKHFGETIVFELDKIINELEEVQVKAEPKQPLFTQETYNANLQNLIKEDIKNNPHLYQPAGATYGVDFIYLIGQVIKLFKRKDTYKEPIYAPITYMQLDSLFAKNSFFNERLLTKSLKIPLEKKYLFLEFLEAKQLSSELLKEDKKMDLLEAMVQSSDLFLILLEEYGNETDIKD
ncbi:hypothetical protein [Winogradskyella ursingii]|uniref:hypothetical protein n=1 Tax=Winogradskyella ursingii TaxID=2686079 RepID=UPI0015CCEF4E|nr:hypothetical protein [Winogradskyella ursingii]